MEVDGLIKEFQTIIGIVSMRAAEYRALTEAQQKEIERLRAELEQKKNA